jgi:hypothetical protein
MINVNVPETALRIIALRRAEERLRGTARRLELNPYQRDLANELFRQASGLRRARLALIERCGLN